MKTILLFLATLLTTTSAHAGSSDACVLIALNASQRQVYSQYGQVDGFRNGCLVVQQDNGIVYEWNGVGYNSIASSSSFLPSQTGNSGKFLTTNGSVTSWGAVSGGANTALSNLATTAVNNSINPGSDINIDLGDSGLNWRNIRAKQIYSSSYAGFAVIQLDNLRLMGPESNKAIEWGSRVLDSSANDPMLDWSTTGVLDAKSNLISNVLNPVSAQDAATKNYVDSNSANTALSNLTNPTSINQDLVPASDAGFDLGSTSKRFSTMRAHAVSLKDASSSEVNMLDGSSILKFRIRSSDVTPITVDGFDYYDTIVSNAGRNLLLQTTGRLALTGSVIDVDNKNIVSLADPVNPQDAATKAYVDANSGSPAGANTEIQYNNSGAFGAASDFTWDESTKTLTMSKAYYSDSYVSSYWGGANPAIVGDSLQIPGGSNAMIYGSTDVNSGSASQTSAEVSIQSGDNNNGTNPTGATGNLWLTTGWQNHAGASGVTGAININTGNNGGSAGSGAIVVGTGTASAATGGLTLTTGQSGSNNSGSSSLNSGNAPGGVSGNVIIHVGTGGTRGKIVMTDGSEGTAGQVWTSTDTVGSGKWSYGPQGTVCGWYDTVAPALISTCQGSDPNVSCPSGYTQKTTTGAKFCAAN